MSDHGHIIISGCDGQNKTWGDDAQMINIGNHGKLKIFGLMVSYDGHMVNIGDDGLMINMGDKGQMINMGYDGQMISMSEDCHMICTL